jgi:hypothetical protein
MTNTIQEEYDEILACEKELCDVLCDVNTLAKKLMIKKSDVEHKLSKKLNKFVENHISNFLHERLHVPITTGVEEGKINVDYVFFKKVYPDCVSLQFDDFKNIVHKVVNNMNEIYGKYYRFEFLSNENKITFLSLRCEWIDHNLLKENFVYTSIFKEALDFLRQQSVHAPSKFSYKIFHSMQYVDDYKKCVNKFHEESKYETIGQTFFGKLFKFLIYINDEEIPKKQICFCFTKSELCKMMTVDNIDANVFLKCINKNVEHDSSIKNESYIDEKSGNIYICLSLL